MRRKADERRERRDGNAASTNWPSREARETWGRTRQLTRSHHGSSAKRLEKKESSVGKKSQGDRRTGPSGGDNDAETRMQ